MQELEGQVEEAHEEAEKRMRVLGQEMESVRLQNEKRVATLTQTNRQLSDKLAVKHGKEPQLVRYSRGGMKHSLLFDEALTTFLTKHSRHS